MPATDIAVRENGHVATERDVVDGWITVAADVSKLSDYIAETDFVPKALRNKPAAIAACILTGRELGIGPMASLKSIHMVQGVPSLSAEYKRARALAAGHQIVIDESTSTRCVVRGRRAGTDQWVTIAWTMDLARRAKIAAKDVWQQYPQRMLQARATSELCDLLFPDATLGLETTEVLEDGGALALAIGTELAAEEEAAASNGHAPAEPKPRTAQRRQRAEAKPGPAAAGTSDAPSTPATSSPGNADLPPLPGEDEPAEPATATPGWVGLIVKHFERLGITDRDVRLGYTGMITGREVESTKDLTGDEAKVVLDMLARCKNQERLLAVLDEHQAAHPGGEARDGG